jgi:hypothetical protein
MRCSIALINVSAEHASIHRRQLPSPPKWAHLWRYTTDHAHDIEAPSQCSCLTSREVVRFPCAVSPKKSKHPDNIDVRRLTSASVTAQMGTPVASIIARDTPALFTLPEGIPTRITLVRFNGTLLPSCSNRSSHQRYSLFHRHQLGIYVSNKEFC